MAAVPSFRENNMAPVTLRENTPYEDENKDLLRTKLVLLLVRVFGSNTL